jgi:hypothetical protein
MVMLAAMVLQLHCGARAQGLVPHCRYHHHEEIAVVPEHNDDNVDLVDGCQNTGFHPVVATPQNDAD